MKSTCLTAVALSFFSVQFAAALPAAEPADAIAAIDKSIQALGGEAKLKAAAAISWKTKGKINFGGAESEFSGMTVVDGLEKIHGEFEGDFGGMKFKGETILNGDKGWRNFGGMIMELDKDGLQMERRNHLLQIVPVTLVALKSNQFKLALLSGEKSAVAVKATGADGKSMTIHFDKESALPVKLIAKVAGFDGQEFTQETTFSDYKEMSGIKKATKIASRRDGEEFIKQEVVEFKILEKVDPKLFEEPK
jgi:hypothetical protein